MFNDALHAMVDAERDALAAHLTSWDQGSCLDSRQVSANIRQETALRLDAFVALLRDFHGEVVSNPGDALGGWAKACRRHQLKGAAVPDPVPHRLGRALTISRYAKLLGPGQISDELAEWTIRKVAMAGTTPGPREARIIRQGPLGQHLIWATFKEDAPTEDPFHHLPCRTEAIRTALGLGHCSETETLVLLTWRREGPWATLALHRPTVADAATFPWYRPVSDPAASWGYTKPLAPNPAALPPCPEVVHQVITGETIVFPVRLAC